MIKGKTKVWITHSRITPDEVQEISDNGQSDHAIGLLSYSSCDMTGSDGWVEVGTAVVEVTFLPREEVTEKMADGLRKAIQAVKAESHVKVSLLEEQLNQLLALPNPDQQQQSQPTQFYADNEPL